MKTGIIDVGGGLRGVYATGVFDCLLDEGIEFDVGIGVSAGSANIASYIAKQRKRNYPFYTEYPFRKEYLSLQNLLFKHSLFDMDYIYSTLSNEGGENPLDYQAMMDSPMDYYAVATNALTGEPKYFTKKDFHRNDYQPFKASCAIPVACHPYEVDGVPYFDGALADFIPIKKMLSLGVDRIVLILTKPKDFIRDPHKDKKYVRLLAHKYPEAAKKLARRAEAYNAGVALARKMEKAGKLLIIAPDNTCGVDTFTKDQSALRHLYDKGYHDGKAIHGFLKRP